MLCPYINEYESMSDTWIISLEFSFIKIKEKDSVIYIYNDYKRLEGMKINADLNSII